MLKFLLLFVLRKDKNLVVSSFFSNIQDDLYCTFMSYCSIVTCLPSSTFNLMVRETEREREREGEKEKERQTMFIKD